MLGGDRLPIGRAHLVGDREHHPTATLLRGEHAVRLRFRAVIGQPEIEHVQRELQVRGADVLLGAGGRLERLAARDDRARGRGLHVVAGTQAGPSGQFRQEVDAGDVERPILERALHQRDAVIEIVLDRPRQRLLERDGSGDGLLRGVHDRAIAGGLGDLFVESQALGGDGACAGKERDRDGRRRAKPSTPVEKQFRAVCRHADPPGAVETNRSQSQRPVVRAVDVCANGLRAPYRLRIEPAVRLLLCRCANRPTVRLNVAHLARPQSGSR